MQKYLRMSKKSSTFARFLARGIVMPLPAEAGFPD